MKFVNDFDEIKSNLNWLFTLADINDRNSTAEHMDFIFQMENLKDRLNDANINNSSMEDHILLLASVKRIARMMKEYA